MYIQGDFIPEFNVTLKNISLIRGTQALWWGKPARARGKWPSAGCQQTFRHMTREKTHDPLRNVHTERLYRFTIGYKPSDNGSCPCRFISWLNICNIENFISMLHYWCSEDFSMFTIKHLDLPVNCIKFQTLVQVQITKGKTDLKKSYQ